MIQDFNCSSLHPDMVTIRAVSARDQFVKSFIREMGYGVVVMSLEGGVLGNLVGGVIGQAGWGGRLGHGGVSVIFYVTMIISG